MSIKPLPGHVIAQIESSVVVTSLNSVICGLVKNSLDAGAQRINLSVDYARGNCSIEDDGQGIPPAEFREHGGLGKLHYTSKYPPKPDRHGCNGTFLAAVATMSLMSVASHHKDYSSHNSLSIHNSRVLARNIPALPQQRLLTFAHGSRVTVRDLFGSMPVRVKQRASDVDSGTTAKDWDSLVRSLVALLLAWPAEVAIAARDASGRQAVSLKTTEPLGEGRKARHHLLLRVPRLLSQASYCDSFGGKSWVSIGASSPFLSISGCVCLTPVATKRVQFLSIGVEPILDEYGSNILFEEINRVFAASAFGVEEGDADEAVDEAQDRPAAMTGFTGREMRGKKGIDRWPMFYVKVCLRGAEMADRHIEVDELLDHGGQRLVMLLDLLRTVFYEFLKKHHYRPRKVRTPTLDQGNKQTKSDDMGQKELQRTSRGTTPRLSRSSRSSSRHGSTDNPTEAPATSKSPSLFDTWSRVKVGHAKSRLPKTTERSSIQESRPPSEKPNVPKETLGSSGEHEPSGLVDRFGNLTRRPFNTALPPEKPPKKPRHAWQAGSNIQPEQKAKSDETFLYEDPISHCKSVVDSRTGFINSTPSKLGKRISSRGTLAGHSGKTAPVSNDASKPEPEPEPEPWLRNLLANWKNPVFEPTEPPIPKVVESTLLGRDGSNCGHSHEASPISLQGRVSKDALKRAQVIAQVDKKFILVKVPVLDGTCTKPRHPGSLQPIEPETLLLIIDQHAADERIRVEALMDDYFIGESGKWKAATERLDKAVRFELSSRETRLLARHRSHFQRWGIDYDLLTPPRILNGGTKKSEAKVQVTSLPPSILERCRLEPRLLIEIIRKEVWDVDQHGSQARRPQTDSDVDDTSDSPWIARFHGCPRGILELIHSRACRSAIMFNDPLTVEECADLIHRLATCALPFQCAHGRPSMVPLVNLGIGGFAVGGEGVDWEQGKATFADKFKQWKAAKRSA